MTELIHFTPTMAFTGNNFPSCFATEFVDRLKNNLSSFEVTPNDKPMKYYFDVDIKTEAYYKNTATAVEDKCKEYIIGALEGYIGITPRIAITTSHSNTKYSFHFYISNLLDKKENMKSFVKKLNQYIKMKNDENNIYDYIEETKDGLFDEAVYDKNRKIRCVNTSKPNEDRPLLLKEGKIEDTIISAYFDNDATIVNFETDKIEKSCDFEPVNFTGNKDDKYLKLLFNVIGNGKHIDFNTWFHIAAILKCNNYTFDILEEYTGIVDKQNPQTFKIWNSIDKNKPFSIYGLESIASKVNKDKYFEWKKENNIIITIEILTNGANDVCQYISKSLKDTLIYCKNSWITCNKSNLWVEINDPSAIIVTAIQSEIDKSMKILIDDLQKELSDEKKDSIRKIIKDFISYRIGANSQMVAYSKLLKTYLANDSFLLNLDTNKYEVAFSNGILDLKTLNFRNGILPTDFVSKTIPFDYMKSTETDKELVRKELLKITNNNKQHLEYYLSILGYAMTGDASRLQEFYYLLGQKACNGKSVIFDALTDIMPNYVIKMGNDTFDKTNNAKHKEIARWKGVRIAWVNELTTSKQDAEFLKEVADGIAISYKAMYKNSEVMDILFKLFMVSNHSFSSIMDEGLKRRLRELQFDSEFVAGLENDDFNNCRFIRDDSFGIKLRNEYKYALLDLIFEYSKKFIDNNYKLELYPTEWKQQTEESTSDGDEFKVWFENNFIFGDYKISKYELTKFLKANGYANIKIKDEYKKNRWNVTSDKNYWYGFKDNINSIEKE